MARPKPAPKPSTKSMDLAHRIRAALSDDPDYQPDDMPQETGVVIEPGAMFHVETADGARYRIRVNRV